MELAFISVSVGSTETQVGPETDREMTSVSANERLEKGSGPVSDNVF